MMYSFAFRKLYKHYHLLNDDDFISSIKEKYNLNLIEYRSLKSEVESRFKKTIYLKDEISEKIILLTEEVSKLKQKERTKKITRKIFKLNKKISYFEKTLSKDIVFGKKSILRQISYLSNKKQDNIISDIERNKLNDLKKEFKKNKLYSFYLLGEANQKGNRFFDFSQLDENVIIYKPYKGKKIEISFSHYKSYKNELLKLKELSENKEISISIYLSTDYISISYDDSKLNGYCIDENERRKEVNEIKLKKYNKDEEKLLIKDVYKKYYNILEEKQLLGKKKNRYFSFDSNPEYIGCAILDKINDNDFKVIKTFYFDLSDLSKDKNKRIHGISHIWKKIFSIIHYYNCSYFIQEELDITNNDLGNRIANRKVNNLWYRELSNHLIQKYIHKNGYIKIDINPVYSSLIGNMLYSYNDCCNAAIEIGRRGMYKYNKNTFYPQFDTNTIIDNVKEINKNINILEYVQCIKDSENWNTLYDKMKESGLRYRWKNNDNYSSNNMKYIDVSFNLY